MYMETSNDLYYRMDCVRCDALDSIRELMEENDCRYLDIAYYRPYAEKYLIYIPHLNYYSMDEVKPVPVVLTGIHMGKDNRLYIQTSREDNGGLEFIDENELDVIEATGIVLCLETIFNAIRSGEIEKHSTID